MIKKFCNSQFVKRILVGLIFTFIFATISMILYVVFRIIDKGIRELIVIEPTIFGMFFLMLFGLTVFFWLVGRALQWLAGDSEL